LSDIGLINWKRTSFPGSYKLFSRLNLDFPISTKENYYIGNLALISEVRQGIFLSAGNTWDDFSELEFTDFKYEGGLELRLSGNTLGGLFPFDLTFGYAYHGQDTGRPFVSFSLSI